MGMVCNCHDSMVSVFFVILYLTVCLFVCLFIFVFVMMQVVGRGTLGQVMQRFVSNMELFNIIIRLLSSKLVDPAFKVVKSK